MFGAFPRKQLRTELAKSANYQNGEFSNYTPIPINTASSYQAAFLTLFKLIKRLGTKVAFPTIKTDLKSLHQAEEVLVWFGHSSYFLQLAGYKFLIDPVFSKFASPIPGCFGAFSATRIYQDSDLPAIDYLIITHDHWDHLDYRTVMRLKNRLKLVICPLGVGAHFRRWKFDNIIELDWNEKLTLDNFVIHCLPTQHFSGRALVRNQTLWGAFLITQTNFKIYLGGDSGYGTHYQLAGQQFGPIDLAILENGQYNNCWQHIHSAPEQTLQAAIDLKAKKVVPAHNSKFHLSSHPWSEPLEKLYQLHQINKSPFELLTPKVGEKLNITANNQSSSRPTSSYSCWWHTGNN